MDKNCGRQLQKGYFNPEESSASYFMGSFALGRGVKLQVTRTPRSFSSETEVMDTLNRWSSNVGKKMRRDPRADAPTYSCSG